MKRGGEPTIGLEGVQEIGGVRFRIAESGTYFGTVSPSYHWGSWQLE
jgi:hypothetical protein